MAATLVGGALLSASLQVLFDRLASHEVLNFFHAKRLNEKLLDRLKTTLYAAGAVVDVAEYQQFTNPSVKSWLDDLRDAVYRANDLFDQISTKAAAQKQVTKIFSHVFRGRKIRNKIAELTDRLESIMKLKDDLGLDNNTREMLGRLQTMWRPPTTSIPEEDVYGRNEAKDFVIKILLNDKDSDDSTLSVIPIMGMGGIGKTTLAQFVYNDDKVEEEFNLKAWICVSDEFHILNITKAILKAVSSGRCDKEDLDSVQLELKNILSKKKFLIVLDDVWNEDYVQWDLLRKPFLHGAKGSKILLTTRSEKVASVVQIKSTYVFHVGQLSEEDSWLLFAKHAFHSLDGAINSNLKNIGRDIVKKCKGLPLAIKTLAGLLRSKNDTKDWNIILKSDLWDLPEKQCKILPALGISYLSLSPHLKQCFAYCSLFPKDYKFNKEELIKLWMAQGYLQSSNEEMSMEEVGHLNFDTLVSMSFLQRSNVEGRFIMHDLMHDLSIFCAGEFCHRLGTKDAINIPKRTRHLSSGFHDVSLQDIEALCAMKANSLQSLILHLSPFESIKAKDIDRMLLKFKLLRVLSLVGFRDRVLPNSIGELILLRYLNLSDSCIQKLPASLCKLSNLQTLKLGHPIILAKGINKLKNLCFLPNIVLSKDEGINIGELGGLPNISKLPLIECMENVRSSKEAIEARMMDKKFIQELGLRWSCTGVLMNDLETDRDILDKLQPHLNLKVLTIDGYRGRRFPDWLGHPSYQNIIHINIWDCNNCSTMPPLGQLPFLKNLSVGGFGKLVNVGAEFYKTSDSPLTTPFPSLELLAVFSMPVLQDWSSIEIEAFPKIQRVLFQNCPELVRCCITAKQMEFIYCSKLEFPNQQRDSLESLILKDSCESISSFTTDTFPHLKELKIELQYKPRNFMRLLVKDGCLLKDGFLPPYLSSLTLINLWNLETFNIEAFQYLTSLQQFNIVGCPNLKKRELKRLAALITKIIIYKCGISAEEVRLLKNVDVVTRQNGNP